LEILPRVFLLSDSIGTVVRDVESKPYCIGLFVRVFTVFLFILHVYLSPLLYPLGQLARLGHTLRLSPHQLFSISYKR
jgi:hypothetical protein